MINKKWYASQSHVTLNQKAPKQWGVSYWKHIKDSPVHGGRIIARVIGKSKEEAEALAAHICEIHNDFLSKIPVVEWHKEPICEGARIVVADDCPRCSVCNLKVSC